MKTYGLIGKNISYSFSRSYFTEKFESEGIEAEYVNFDLSSIEEFPKILESTRPTGCNVTIPYKEKIIPYLNRLDPVAREIGAVNTVKFEEDESLTGYNTDYYGFMESLKPFLKPEHKKALILGTGGASKAVAYALKLLDISYSFVSRTPGTNQFSYSDLSENIINDFKVIINSTPLGTHPNITNTPALPVEFLSSRHLLYDLIYNPPVTRLMKLAEDKGAIVINGKRMLELQAEKAWSIWASK